MIDLDATMTQAAFGELVGISQQAVSDLQARDIIRQGDTARVQLLAYCNHLREMAAGRDPDGQLVSERARVAKETADKIAMANAITRKEYAPVGLLEVVLSDLARQLNARLDGVVPQLKRTMPDLPAPALAAVAKTLAVCRGLCADVNIANAERLAGDEDEGDEG